MNYLLVALGLLVVEGPLPDPKPYLRHPHVAVQLKSSPCIHVRHGKRGYGTPKTIRLLKKAAHQVCQQFPKAPRLKVGDISWVGGGKMPPHLSHHRGRDVDISYYRLPTARDTGFFSPTSPTSIDAKLTWIFIEALLETHQVEYIFMAYPLQRTLYQHARKLGYSAQSLKPVFQYPRPSWEREAIIRWVKGHHTHFHIRFVSSGQAISDWFSALWTGSPVKRTLVGPGPPGGRTQSNATLMR
jgi:murein endopeptidase